jgi:hypothetical protein
MKSCFPCGFELAIFGILATLAAVAVELGTPVEIGLPGFAFMIFIVAAIRGLRRGTIFRNGLFRQPVE